MIQKAKEYFKLVLFVNKKNISLLRLIPILCSQRNLTYSKKGLIHDSCIYKIVSKKTKKCYIGSAKKFNRRKSAHLWHLKKGSHHSSYLQNHVNKYGLDDIVFEILAFVDILELVEKEQYYIDLFRPEFNISKNAYSTLGVKCSEEKKELLKKLFTGRKATPEAVEANRLGQLKRLPPTEETRRKISLANKGRVVSEDFKIKNLFSQKTRKEVICLDTNVKYPSLRAASRNLNIPKEQIRYVCEGKHTHARKLKFKFA